jgi:hypothetical protein
MRVWRGKPTDSYVEPEVTGPLVLPGRVRRHPREIADVRLRARSLKRPQLLLQALHQPEVGLAFVGTRTDRHRGRDCTDA